jgi:Trypsin-like peptidase domain
MGMLAARGAILVAAMLGLSGPAFAGDATADRSALSYADNVTINMACYAAGQHGRPAYDQCVAAQLAALKAHPSPDRSGLSALRNRDIEQQCAYQRSEGIGPYNDCLRQAMAAPAPPPDRDSLDENFGANIAKVFAVEPGHAKPAAIQRASLPLPDVVLPGRPSEIEHATLSPAQIFKKVERSIFVVFATPSLADARSRNVALGSAVAVAPHLLLTNCHIVEDRPVIRIVRDEESIVATLVAADFKADRCILKSEGPPLPPIAGIRTFRELAVGERVFAIGTPVGLTRTLTQGLISGLRNFNGRNLVQTDAPLSPGNSGGGLFDESGNLIGITTLASRAGAELQNLNFAIAASDYWTK